MLAAGMLETNLRLYLKAKGIKTIRSNSTLGYMVKQMKDCHLLTRNGEMHFDDLVLKRNYLAHNLYDLFSEVIEETILPCSQLVDADIHMFRDRALSLAEDFLLFAKHVASADLSDKPLL